MPLGVSGVITMKIMRSTSKISISGTTFISATAPPLLLPTLIPIASLQSAPTCEGLEPMPLPSSGFVSTNPETRPGGIRQGLVQRMVQLLTKCEKRSVAGRRRRRCSGLFRAFGQQTQLIDTSRANLVHDGNHVAVLGPGIPLEIDRLVQFVGNTAFNFAP